MPDDSSSLPPELVMQAYCQGIFPMARSRTGSVEWYTADPRAIIPLERFRYSRSLGKRIRRGDYRVTRDQAFEQVIHACAQPRSYERET